MGIKGLLRFISEYPNLIINKNIESYYGKKIAIDISIMLYQVVIAIRNSGADLKNKNGKITSHILGIFNKTCTLLKRGIIPIYIFDGKPPLMKLNVLENRKDNRKKAYELMINANTEEERIKYFKRCVTITSEQIMETQELLEYMGIPFIVAIEEADQQCAYMSQNNLVEGVMTEDMDILTFGAKKIIRNLASYRKNINEIDLSKILEKLNLTYNNFIEFCILLGCDYSKGLSDIKPNILYKYYIVHKNIPDTIISLREDGYEINEVDFAKIKNYFLNNNNVITEFNDSLCLKKPNIELLEDLLVNKYGLLKNKVINKINFLEKNFSDGDDCNIVDECILNI